MRRCGSARCAAADRRGSPRAGCRRRGPGRRRCCRPRSAARGTGRATPSWARPAWGPYASCAASALRRELLERLIVDLVEVEAEPDRELVDVRGVAGALHAQIDGGLVLAFGVDFARLVF